MPVNGFDNAKNKVQVYSTAEANGLLDGKQNKAVTMTVTLSSGSWSSISGGYQQSVAASGVTASNIVIVAPAASAIAEYSAKKVYCYSQASDSLVFRCAELPENNLSVNVLVLGV